MLIFCDNVVYSNLIDRPPHSGVFPQRRNHVKILSITAQKPHSTGSGTYMTELVRSWHKAGHRQAVVCGIYPDDPVGFPDGVTCYPVFFTDTAASQPASEKSLFAPCKLKTRPGPDALPFPIVGMSDIMPYTSTRYRDLTPQMISRFEQAFIDAVSRAVSELDPDLIVCHHLFLLTALVRKHFPDSKIYGISHGTDLRQMINCDNLRELVRPEIARIDRALALHDDQRAKIMELFGLPEDRVTVIGSGYNDGLFNTENRASRQEICAIAEEEVPVMICYAGKMSRPKGVPELLEALKTLSADPGVPRFEVTLAGGCQDESVQKQLDDLPDNIEWLGQISQDHLADVMKYSDIFVLPSYFEGLPLVLIEAMASGAVPVSTDLPGVRPWIDANVPGSNARFVPMPEMETIDSPTEAGRRQFVMDLTGTLRSLITEISSGASGLSVPDTSGITWSGVAGRILNL